MAAFYFDVDSVFIPNKLPVRNRDDAVTSIRSSSRVVRLVSKVKQVTIPRRAMVGPRGKRCGSTRLQFANSSPVVANGGGLYRVG
jgi:hypothetical protein